jgi:hypothetical protein
MMKPHFHTFNGIMEIQFIVFKIKTRVVSSVIFLIVILILIYR